MHRHRTIICEDDPEVAEVLVETLAMIDHETLVVKTVDEFRSAFLEFDPCLGLQDLQVPVNAKAKPAAASGETCIEFARKHKPERNADRRHLYQILVVTAVVEGPAYGIELANLGADDFIKKPCGDPTVVHKKIALALERAGRKDHESCIALSRGARADAAPGALLLSLSAERDDQRTFVTLGGKRAALRGKTLELLVRLVDARLKGDKWTARDALKIPKNNNLAYRLNEEFWEGGLFPKEFLVCESNRLNECRLNPAIELGNLAWPDLTTHPNPPVAKIAAERAAKKKR
jgi:DNA-binding response OmpR family regulator